MSDVVNNLPPGGYYFQMLPISTRHQSYETEGQYCGHLAKLFAQYLSSMLKEKPTTVRLFLSLTRKSKFSF